jgi:hypothetical protein
MHVPRSFVTISLLLLAILCGCSQRSPSPATSAPATSSVEKKDTSPEDFKKVLAALQKESFDDGKLSFLKTVAKTRRFTAEQIREILKAFSFDAGREEAAVIVYPSMSDPEDFFVVFDAFTFDSGRTSLRRRLKLE